MQQTRWLRYGLASMVAAFAGVGATLAACSDDSTSSGTAPAADSGTPDTATPTGDSGGTDSGKPDAGPIAKLTLVNAATDLGPNAYVGSRQQAGIRVCFKSGTSADNTSVAPYPPLPDSKPSKDFSGVFYGTGGTFPSLGVDLEPRLIIPIVMNAMTLKAKGIENPNDTSTGPGCEELVGDQADAALGLVANRDYWELPAIPIGTFKRDHSYILLFTGCAADADLTAIEGSIISPQAKCGPGFDPANPIGNLKVTILETNRTPVSATDQGIQFVNASAQFAATFGPLADGAYRPGFVSDPAPDASAEGGAGAGYRSVTSGAAAGYLTINPAVGVGFNDSDFFVAGPSDLKGKALLPFPVPAIQAFSGLGLPTAPTVYTGGKNYVFVGVGDPDTAATPPRVFPDGNVGDGGGAFNTKFFHFLAFPTDPVIEAYTP